MDVVVTVALAELVAVEVPEETVILTVSTMVPVDMDISTDDLTVPTLVGSTQLVIPMQFGVVIPTNVMTQVVTLIGGVMKTSIPTEVPEVQAVAVDCLLYTSDAADD